MSQRLLGGVRRCSRCGKRLLWQGYSTQHKLTKLMERKSLCYDCAYWEDIIANPPRHMEVVGRSILQVCPEADKSDRTVILGGKGKFRFFLTNDFRAFRSNDVWLLGRVDDEHARMFAPTAIEITRKAYASLMENPRKCKARACFDRYRCLRYNLALEAEGAYNKIPKGWKIGDERCKYFIDMDKDIIKHD